MPKTIAVFNQAGGVGKSTLTQNLGYQLAARNNRVLLVDMDPQGSLTLFMGFELEELESTIYDALLPESEAETHEPPIIGDRHGMDLVPSNIRLANAEQELIFEQLREMRLGDVLSTVSGQYDYILIDCPPSLGILSQISLVAATHLLVPIQCQFKSLMGTDGLLRTVSQVRKRLNPELQFAGFVPTMYQRNNSLDNRILGEIQEQLEKVAPVFAPMPRATAVAEAAELGVPLALSTNKHAATLKLFDQLAAVMEKM